MKNFYIKYLQQKNFLVNNGAILLRLTVNLVPLHKPSDGFKFRISITTAPFFKVSSCRKISDNIKEFKYSIGIILQTCLT